MKPDYREVFNWYFQHAGQGAVGQVWLTRYAVMLTERYFSIYWSNK